MELAIGDAWIIMKLGNYIQSGHCFTFPVLFAQNGRGSLKSQSEIVASYGGTRINSAILTLG